ncbi:MAG: asparaginase [Bacillota bacterium]
MKKLVLLATGGTISTQNDEKQGGLIAKLNGEEILNQLLNQNVDLEVQNFSTVNSTYLTPQDMYLLAKRVEEILQRNDIDGIVITHGTSTMEESGFMLDILIENHKPVVITGSQRPSSDQWPDGPQNLEAAIRVAASNQAENKGVMVVFASKIFQAREIQKIHTYGLEAFDSGDKGLLGFVYSDKVVFYSDKTRKKLTVTGFADYPVDIIKFYAGADKKFFKAVIANKVKGIVVEGVGLGNVNGEFYQGIKEALSQGIEVVITSRSYMGRVIPQYGYPGGGLSLEKLGVIFGEGLPSPKARILLMLAFNQGLKREEIRELFKMFP